MCIRIMNRNLTKISTNPCAVILVYFLYCFQRPLLAKIKPVIPIIVRQATGTYFNSLLLEHGLYVVWPKPLNELKIMLLTSLDVFTNCKNCLFDIAHCSSKSLLFSIECTCSKVIWCLATCLHF